MFLKAHSKDRGFTLIDLMVAMGLCAVAIVTTIEVIGQAGKLRKIENLRSSAVAVREQLIKNMARYDNFQETIHNNTTNFACLLTHNCGVTNMAAWNGKATQINLATAKGKNFNLRVATGGSYPAFSSTAFYNAANAAEGFTDEGLPCHQKSPVPTGTAPNKYCPIRADLYWWSLCSGTCNPGLIGIKVVIKTYNDLTEQTVTTPYGFQLIKSVYDDGQQGPFPVYSP